MTHRGCGSCWWLAVTAVALGAGNRSRRLSTSNVVICASTHTCEGLFQIMRRLDGVRRVRMCRVGRVRSGGGCAGARPGSVGPCGGCVGPGGRQ